MQRRALHERTYKGQLHFGLNREASWHIHRNTHKTGVLIITAHSSRELWELHYRCLCIFSWLSSSCASSETCSTKHKLTWRQPLPCRREKSPVICRITAAAFFIFKVKGRLRSCKLARKISKSCKWAPNINTYCTNKHWAGITSWGPWGYLYTNLVKSPEVLHHSCLLIQDKTIK